MVNPAGNLSSTYNADETHFNDSGHRLVFAQLLSLLKQPFSRATPRLASPAAGHAVSNPLLDGTIGSNYPTGWSRNTSSTVTPTVTLAANNNGAGNKLTFTLDSTGAAVTYIVNIPMASTTWSSGDKLGVTYSVNIIESTGTWDDCSAAGGSLKFYVMNGASVHVGVGPGRQTSVKRNYNKVTAPSGNGMRLWIVQPVGFIITYEVSEVDVLNETTLGVSL